MHHGEVKDVFISYRREDGATAARLLCDALERRNISTFFDKETIEGDFHQSIKNNLAAARNVLVVVSAKMFSRHLLEDGSYDLEAVKNDWVYEELRISIELRKNIIPVFVNGVTGFPLVLPKTIEKLAVINGMKLDHEHFDAELRKLIGLLVTPKHQLLEKFLEVNDEFYGDNFDSLLKTCISLSSDNGSEIESMLVRLVRKNWDNSQLSYEAAVDALINGFGTDALKRLCSALELDDTGGARRLKLNMINWLKGESKFRKYNQSESNKDRLTELIEALALVFKSPNARQEIAEVIIHKCGVELDGSKRSSRDIFSNVFDVLDVEEFFSGLAKIISEDDVKLICTYLLIDERGRKMELIDRIIDYVNYDFHSYDEIEAD